MRSEGWVPWPEGEEFNLVITDEGAANIRMVGDAVQCSTSSSTEGRVRVFFSTDTLLAAFGSNQNGDFELDLPRGVAVDQVGNVYVANTDEDEIKKFTPD